MQAFAVLVVPKETSRTVFHSKKQLAHQKIAQQGLNRTDNDQVSFCWLCWRSLPKWRLIHVRTQVPKARIKSVKRSKRVEFRSIGDIPSLRLRWSDWLMQMTCPEGLFVVGVRSWGSYGKISYELFCRNGAQRQTSKCGRQNSPHIKTLKVE